VCCSLRATVPKKSGATAAERTSWKGGVGAAIAGTDDGASNCNATRIRHTREQTTPTILPQPMLRQSACLVPEGAGEQQRLTVPYG